MPSQDLIGPFVRRFLLEHVAADRNLSPHTQKSYRDGLRLLFEFLATQHGTDPTRVTVQQVDVGLVREFLCHLEASRGNSVATRNRRLAALRSLFRFIGRLQPELADHAAQVCAIPDRKAPIPVIPYLSKPEVEGLLAVPDRSTQLGRRNYCLLLLLYNTGARASEAAGLAIADLNLHGSPSARFLSQRRRRLTRFGVYEVVTRVACRAARDTPSLRTKRISPHTLRHTTAAHLLQAGVDINTIRAWLGHVSLETTNRYAEVDLETKARALQMCAKGLAEPPAATSPSWHRNSDLMAFLASL